MKKKTKRNHHHNITGTIPSLHLRVSHLQKQPSRLLYFRYERIIHRHSSHSSSIQKKTKNTFRGGASRANSLTSNHHVAMIRSLLTSMWTFVSLFLVAHSRTKPSLQQRKNDVECTLRRWAPTKTLLFLMMGLPQVAASDNDDAIDALMADMKNSEKDSVQGISFLSHVEQAIEKNTLCRTETSTCVMTTYRMEWARQGLDAFTCLPPHRYWHRGHRHDILGKEPAWMRAHPRKVLMKAGRRSMRAWDSFFHCWKKIAIKDNSCLPHETAYTQHAMKKALSPHHYVALLAVVAGCSKGVLLMCAVLPFILSSRCKAGLPRMRNGSCGRRRALVLLLMVLPQVTALETGRTSSHDASSHQSGDGAGWERTTGDIRKECSLCQVRGKARP